MPRYSAPSKEDTCPLFYYLGGSPGPWWLSSCRLKKAADILQDTCWPKTDIHADLDGATADFQLGPVYMLLMGMAIEAALKAAIVAMDNNIIGRATQGIPKKFATHSLTYLWNWAGLNRVKSRQISACCTRLQEFVTTFGRYPVTRSKCQMAQTTRYSFHADPDLHNVERLWQSVEKRLKEVAPELFEENSST